ncbi:MAG: hypothetical protein QXD42_06865 [Nitrososphaerales archaeon]
MVKRGIIIDNVGCVKCIEEGKGFATINLKHEEAFVLNHKIYCSKHKPINAKLLKRRKR